MGGNGEAVASCAVCVLNSAFRARLWLLQTFVLVSPPLLTSAPQRISCRLFARSPFFACDALLWFTMAYYEHT